jgi:hypothetical protein
MELSILSPTAGAFILPLSDGAYYPSTIRWSFLPLYHIEFLLVPPTSYEYKYCM